MATTTTPVVPQDYLRVSDLDGGGIDAVLDLSARMKERPHGFIDALRGDTVACFFEKPSTRTRVSFAAAAERLACSPSCCARTSCSWAGGRRSGTPRGRCPATRTRS